MSQAITEENVDIIKSWFDPLPEGMTIEAFMSKLDDEYHHDYGTVVHAMTAVAYQAACAFNKTPQGGITGFQASCVMWEFIKRWMRYDGAMRLLQFSDMLYPQYSEKFQKVLPEESFVWLQGEARKKLEESGNSANLNVVNHWQSIVNGEVPFGWTVDQQAAPEAQQPAGQELPHLPEAEILIWTDEELQQVVEEVRAPLWKYKAVEVLRTALAQRREPLTDLQISAAIDAERDALKVALECERMRVVACGVVARSDTPKSAAVARDMLPVYRSAACDDVARRVDECISLRAERDALLADAERYRWLRQGDNDEEVLRFHEWATEVCVNPTPMYLPRLERLDKLIDAAMKGTENTTGGCSPSA